MKGLDISQWQTVGTGDQAQDFLIVKATEGVGFTDPSCDAHYQRAKAQGKLLGFYHFARPDLGNSAEAEADYFIQETEGYFRQAIPILDWECSVWNVGWAKAWLDRVYARTGIRPMIYMSASVVNGYDWSQVSPYYGLWIAGYPPQFDRPNPPEASVDDMPYGIGSWAFWCIWQYTSSGGKLDRNVACIDPVAWSKYAGYYQEPVAEPKPEPTPEPQPEPEPIPEPKPSVEPEQPVDEPNIFERVIMAIINFIRNLFKKGEKK